MRAALGHVWRAAIAAALLTGVSLVSYEARYGFQQFAQAESDMRVVLGWLALSKSLVACSLAYVAVRSRWSGTQLMVAVFVAYFGVDSFINQSHAMLLGDRGIVPATGALLVAHGFLVGLLFSFSLVLVMGRMRDSGFVEESARLHLPVWEWFLKLGICCVAWLAFYGCLCSPAAPVLQWQRVGMQVLRALLMIVFLLPVIKMLKGGRLETALAVAVLLLALGALAPIVSRRLLLQERLSLVRIVGLAAAHSGYGFLGGYLFSRQSA